MVAEPSAERHDGSADLPSPPFAHAMAAATAAPLEETRQAFENVHAIIAGLRADHNTWTHSVVDGQQRLTALQQAVHNLENTTGEMSRRFEAMMAATADRLTQLETGRSAVSSQASADRPRSLIDPKHLLPEMFGGSKQGPAWRD